MKPRGVRVKHGLGGGKAGERRSREAYGLRIIEEAEKIASDEAVGSTYWGWSGSSTCHMVEVQRQWLILRLQYGLQLLKENHDSSP